MNLMKTITPLELSHRLAAGEPCRLLDVRTPCEYEQLHVPDTLLEPVESLNPAAVALRLPGGPGRLYVFCRTGARARRAIAELERAGVAECVLVEGGIAAWDEAGLPVVRGQSGIIGLERQVRIAAGAMVLSGTLLGGFWSQVFLVLPAFVGAGLIFAGVTERCGLGLLLARMPWNRLSGVKQSCECGAQTT